MSLTETQRAVLSLADGSLTVTQIAEAIGCHRGDVSRAVKKLRAGGHNPLVAWNGWADHHRPVVPPRCRDPRPHHQINPDRRVSDGRNRCPPNQ